MQSLWRPNSLLACLPFFEPTMDTYSADLSRPTDPALTLREGLTRYYTANPDFIQDRDMQVGPFHIPWQDLLRHDLMHVVTGYSTDLDAELQLLGFLLTALSWKRPWYYYVQSIGVFLELLWQSLTGRSWGSRYVNPLQVCQLYCRGIQQGYTVKKKIDAYVNPEALMETRLDTLRWEYGIVEAVGYSRFS
jgi:ubiquinone biosynthesis protein Coq4